MSTPQWRSDTGLIDQLLQEPHRFQFFQAVRLIERWRNDVRASAGVVTLPDLLRFRNSASLAFPPSEIESLEALYRVATDPDAEPAQFPDRIELTPAFMSLLGVSGTLPLSYTEHLTARELQARDPGARRFLDLFTHRAVALFYTAWKKQRLHLQYETDRKNRFLPMVLSLGGLGQSPLRDRLGENIGGMSDESVAFFAGTLQQRTLSAAQLAQVLSRYLNATVRVEQFAGRWYDLPGDAQTELGRFNGVLGSNALCGTRIWQRHMRVRLVIGPLDIDRFRRLLPGGPGSVALTRLATLLTGASLEYEVKLVLAAKAVQGCRLDSARSPMAGRLGWDTFLQSQPQTIDRDDVRYDIQAAALH